MDSMLLLAVSLESAYYVVIGALGFVVAFGLAVFVHELGHFVAAKAFGVRVERFVIGMDKAAVPALPRCIVEWKRGETTYGISVVPLGGYVKMTGPVHPDIERELDGPPAAEAAPRQESLAEQAVMDQVALYRKPFWQKFIIYSAGVAMNLLLAMLVIVFVSVRGVERDNPLPPEVGWINPKGPLAALDVRTGDRVVEVNGAAVVDDASYSAALLAGEHWKDDRSTAALALMRGGGPTTITLQLALNASKDATPAEKALAADVGALIRRPAHVFRVVPNGPADEAGVRDGDTIRTVNGEVIHDWNHLFATIRASADKALAMEIERGGTTVTLTVTPWASDSEKGVGQAGIVYGNSDRTVVRKELGVAIQEAPELLVANALNYVAGLKRLVDKIVTVNVTGVHRNISGPVGIAQVAGRAAQAGFDRWLEFVIMLNIALAVMNILPIPVLDGGHIVFAAYEGMFGRPLPARIFVRVMEGALLFFLAFFVLVTFSDVWKLF